LVFLDRTLAERLVAFVLALVLASTGAARPHVVGAKPLRTYSRTR